MAPDLTVFELPPCDQYTVQGDAFAGAVREGAGADAAEDALGNLRVIEQILATLTSADRRPAGAPARRGAAILGPPRRPWPVQGGRTGGR